MRRVLVFGGSRGAHALNLAWAGALPRLAGAAGRVHAADRREPTSPLVRAPRPPRGSHAEVLPFLDDMPARLAAADLVVCRAGAMTLAELTAAGRPAILVPYPHAANDHQRANARALAARGAARVLEQTSSPPSGWPSCCARR